MGSDRSPAIPIRSFPDGEDRSVHRYHSSPFRRGWIRALLISLCVVLVSMALLRNELFREFEMRTLDARFRVRGTQDVVSPISVVMIDDYSVDRFGRWPWSWDHHALLIDVLNRAGARYILFDIFFTEEPSRSEAVLLGEMARQAGNVFFCSFLSGFESPAPDDDPPLIRGVSLTEPVPPVFSGAAGTGHCNALPDSDGNTRRVPLFMRHGEDLYPAAMLNVAERVAGIDPAGVEFGNSGMTLPAAGGGRRFIPVDERGQTMVSFAGGLEAFPAFSFRQVLEADRYPARSPLDLDAFRDQIVVVGVTFTGNTDLRPTPFSPAYPMVAIQATLLDNILRGDFVKPASRPLQALLWLLVGSLAGLTTFSFRPRYGFPAVLLIAAGYAAAATYLFAANLVHLQIVGPITAVVLSYIAVTTVQYTETRQQKMHYLERMKYLGHLVESATDAIISFDLQGNVVSWNHGAREIYGYSEDDVLSRSAGFLAGPDGREHLMECIRSTLDGRAGESREMTFCKADGEQIPVEASFSQIRDSRGDLVGLSLISQDLSEKKKMIEVLVQSEKLAEIGRMGSGIVHEIKNPLTSIMMMSGIMTSDEKLPEKARRYADIIEKESQRILRLSRNILSFARPKKAEMKAVDLNGLLQETLELAEYELKKAKVRLEEELDADLPSVRGDGEKLKQVFLNIVTNAAHAMEGGGRLSVTTSSGPVEPAGHGENRIGAVGKDRAVRVVFADDGPGVPEEILDKIFEPFFSTKGEGKGTGLGLYISRNIILEHDGVISAASREGAGTRFTIALPPRD